MIRYYQVEVWIDANLIEIAVYLPVFLVLFCFLPHCRSKKYKLSFLFLKFLIQLQIGVELEANTRMQDCTTCFGYQLDLPKANLLFKGKVK